METLKKQWFSGFRRKKEELNRAQMIFKVVTLLCMIS
jgi:hypothetical protein